MGSEALKSLETTSGGNMEPMKVIVQGSSRTVFQRLYSGVLRIKVVTFKDKSLRGSWPKGPQIVKV